MNDKMVKRIIAILIAVLIILPIIVLCLTGCGNYAEVDTVRTYDRALVEMPGGEVMEIEVKSWRDYDGEQIQIVATDGTVYLVSSFNCVLIRDK